VKDDKTVIKISDLETLDDPSVPGRKINWLQSSAVERHDCLESVALPVIEAVRSNVILYDIFSLNFCQVISATYRLISG